MLSFQLFVTGNKALHSHSYCFYLSTLQHLWVVEKCFANGNVVTHSIKTLLAGRGTKPSVKDLSKGSASHLQARSPHLLSHQTFILSCKLPAQWIAALQKRMCVYINTYICFPKWEEKKERTFTSFCWACTGRGRSSWSWPKSEL